MTETVYTRFSEPSEFLAEIRADLAANPHCVERRIVRVTIRTKPTEMSPICSVSLVAGAIVHGRLVRLSRYFGEGCPPSDRRAHEAANDAAESLRRAVTEMGLEPRSGAYMLEE